MTRNTIDNLTQFNTLVSERAKAALRGVVRLILLVVVLPIGFVLGCAVWCFLQGYRVGRGTE
jgi:hypothetical protein